MVHEKDTRTIMWHRLEQGHKLPLTTRLQKGGALLSDMRLLVMAWSDDLAESDPVQKLGRVLPKATMARVNDTFIRAYRPRFLAGSPRQAWRLVRVLEDAKTDVRVQKAFYYWITARAEPPLYDFVSDVVYSRLQTGDRAIRTEDAVTWLARESKNAGKTWTPLVTRKVARGILAALRDFGILEGTVRKHIAAVNLQPEAFCLLAFCLHEMGASGREIVLHPDWRLFLLGETNVEHLLLSCHQHGWLRYEAAGAVCRIEFPTVPFPEYVHDVLG